MRSPKIYYLTSKSISNSFAQVRACAAVKNGNLDVLRHMHRSLTATNLHGFISRNLDPYSYNDCFSEF